MKADLTWWELCDGQTVVEWKHERRQEGGGVSAVRPGQHHHPAPRHLWVWLCLPAWGDPAPTFAPALPVLSGPLPCLSEGVAGWEVCRTGARREDGAQQSGGVQVFRSLHCWLPLSLQGNKHKYQVSQHQHFSDTFHGNLDVLFTLEFFVQKSSNP